MQYLQYFQIKTRLKDLQKFRNIGIHITDEVTCGYNWYFNHVFFFSMTGRVLKWTMVNQSVGHPYFYLVCSMMAVNRTVEPRGYK